MPQCHADIEEVNSPASGTRRAVELFGSKHGVNEAALPGTGTLTF